MRHSKYLKIFVFISISLFLSLGLSLMAHANVPYRGTLGITQESDAGGEILTKEEFVKLKKRVRKIKNLLLRQKKSRKSNLTLVLKMSERLFRACGKIEIESNIDKCHAAAGKAEMQMKRGIESSDIDIKAAIDIMINEVITPFNRWVDDAVVVLEAREKSYREHPEERP